MPKTLSYGLIPGYKDVRPKREERLGGSCGPEGDVERAPVPISEGGREAGEGLKERREAFEERVIQPQESIGVARELPLGGFIPAG